MQMRAPTGSCGHVKTTERMGEWVASSGGQSLVPAGNGAHACRDHGSESPETATAIAAMRK